MGKASQKLSEKISFKNDKWPFASGNGNCLFNEELYIKSCIPKKDKLYRFSMWKSKEEVVGVNYTVENQNVRIGDYASFCMPEADESIAFHHIQAFIENFLMNLISRKIKSISWKHFPSIYSPYLSSNINQALLNFGFIVENNSLNHHLNLKKDFKENLSGDASRRLSKTEKKNIKVHILDQFDLDEYYKYLVKWREKKGRNISVELNTLKELHDSFPDSYNLFIAEFMDRKIAMCLGVRINSKVLYYFLPDQDSEFDDLSPSLSLLNAMHSYAKDKNYEYLDLGISTFPGEEENLGLIRFKEKIGGVPSLKVHYFKELK